MEQVETTIMDMVGKALNAPIESDQMLLDRATATKKLDSMALLELIVGLEEHFRVELIDPDFDAPRECRSVRSLAELVMRKLQAAGR